MMACLHCRPVEDVAVDADSLTCPRRVDEAYGADTIVLDADTAEVLVGTGLASTASSALRPRSSAADVARCGAMVLLVLAADALVVDVRKCAAGDNLQHCVLH